MLHSVGVDVLHKESPDARPKDRYFRYSTGNRVWLAVHSLPILNALSTSIAWILKNGWASLCNGSFTTYPAGLKETVCSLGKALKNRQAIKPGTGDVLR